MPAPEKSATLFRNACREVWVCLVLFALALTWTVGYCYLFGHDHPPESWVVRNGLAAPASADDLRVVLGLPGWVFWGIFVPWVLCVAFTMLYSSFGMSDDDLGAEKGVGDGH